jgi:hypothetical protein
VRQTRIVWLRPVAQNQRQNGFVRTKEVLGGSRQAGSNSVTSASPVKRPELKHQ